MDDITERPIPSQIDVVVNDIPVIYKNIRQQIFEDFEELPLSDTSLGGVLRKESTGVMVVSSDSGEREYSVSSYVYLSEEELASQEQGFFNTDQIEVIKKHIENAGFKMSEAANLVEWDISLDEDLKVCLNLGYRSREEMIKSMQETIAKAPQIASEHVFRKTLPKKVDSGMVNDSQMTFRLEGIKTDFSSLTTEKEFERAIKLYAKAYKLFLQGIYKSKRQAAPETTIFLEPHVS
jgi:hypothetical protein